MKTWYHLIDAFRGFALLNMLLFHFLYDVNMVFGQNHTWYSRETVHIWQQFICISFLFISGISWHFGKNNMKRAVMLNLYGLCITLVTLVFLPSQVVWFGILNCIGCCILLLQPLHRFLTNKFVSETADPQSVLLCVLGFALSIGAFCFTRQINEGYVGFASHLISVPDILYRFKPFTILGFPYDGFFSSDYFSILPWFFIYLAGYFFWAVARREEQIRTLFCVKVPLFSRIGKKTIWIYLLHQPILYGLAYLIVHFL